jgi:hypothetical protein
MPSYSKVDASFSIYISNPPNASPTVKDVRDWLSLIDQFNISDDYPLTDASLSIDVFSQTVEPVCCGECSPNLNSIDALIVTHQCTHPYSGS